MANKRSIHCSLATFQFKLDTDSDKIVSDNFEKLQIKLSRIKGATSIVHQPLMGPYVWVTIEEPHGRFIVSHEIIKETIEKFLIDLENE